MNCTICGRDSEEEYCRFHHRSYSNLVEKFEVWQRAKGSSWKQYLKAVVENSYTGAWAKEIAEHLLNRDDKT